MALSAKLQMRHSQALVMTPQLLQSIRLLQYSHAELQAFIDSELEKNPLLQTAENDGEAGVSMPSGEMPDPDGIPGGQSDPIGTDLAVSASQVEGDLDTSLENVYDADRTGETPPGALAQGSSGSDPWKSASTASGSEQDLEAWCSVPETMQQYLRSQVPLALRDPAQLIIASEIIESLDDDGYLRRPLDEIAAALGSSRNRVESVLLAMQALDPPGICARDLGECLAIQLRQKDRYDPAMAALLENLELLARRDFAQLCRICEVDMEDMREMVGEIRSLDPRPGLQFQSGASQAVVADVLVEARSDGSWSVDLNPETLPRVLVNRNYHAMVAKACRNEDEKTFVADCLQNATWLTKSLDQRAQTILKVAVEIVRQQDMFLAYGVEHLRPLNLRTVAEAISMHESTVSRVTSNKYMMTPRGLFELKYFFTASIAATGGEDAHSAEAVRHRIRQMIESETPQRVLSDDAIVEKLHGSGIEIARRTVAKYRESLGIPSSVQRRREKLAFEQA